MRLWDKGESIDDLVLRFTVGDDPTLDARLVPYDVRASRAHCSMLASQGLLSQADAEAINGALQEIGEAFDRGEWSISIEEEDCHTALEARLVAKLGDAGGKLHLGRSRNDQVLVALRLYLLDAMSDAKAAASEVAQALRDLAERHEDVPLPGYTHQQRAMPSSVRLWAEGFAAEIETSLATLCGAEALLSLNPLGSAAGYGTPGLKLDRDATTAALGFQKTHEPVTAVQLSRGKGEAALAFSLSLLMLDLGRLAADLCLFATQEFGFVSLDPAITTGSSIMPQKRNPDVYELVRAHSSQASVDLQAILAISAKLPSGYHRDLQLLKPPLLRSIDRALACCRVMSTSLAKTQFVPARTRAAMDRSLFAAEAAFKLVREEGLSFREAYRRVAAEFKDAR